MLVIGDDLHVRNSYLHVTDEAGQLIMQGRVQNDEARFQALWEGLLRRRGGEIEPVRLILEATTNTRGMVSLLQRTAQRAGIPLQTDVVNPRKIRLIAESVSKYDGLDGRVLNELGRSNLRLPLGYVPDDDEFGWREHLRARLDLVVLRTMLKNRVHALLPRRAIVVPEGGIFTRDGRRWLGELTLDESGQILRDRFLALIDGLDQELTAVERQVRQAARRPRWARNAARLQSMPGVGLITALTILAELGDLKRFQSRAAVSNYSGLVPRLRASNDTVHRGHITRQGSVHLRGVLTEAAWVAVRRVPAYQTLFERIRARRGPKIAIVAVARRMLEDAYVLLKKQVSFRFDAVRVGAEGSWRVVSRRAGAASIVAG
jgi:transposase